MVGSLRKPGCDKPAETDRSRRHRAHILCIGHVAARTRVNADQRSQAHAGCHDRGGGRGGRCRPAAHDRGARRVAAAAADADGAVLAVTVEGPTGEDSVSVVYGTRLVVGPVRGSAEAMGTSCLPCFDWLPSGGWLVFALDEPSRLAAYRLGHRRAHTLGVKTSP